MMPIPIRTLVKRKNDEDEKIGVVVNGLPAPLGILEEGDVAVVFDGVTHEEAVPESDLEVIGPEKITIEDPKKCGVGMGAECCIFIAMGGNGFECQRFGEMRYTLMFRTMNAKRHPGGMYPRCQLSKERVA